MNKLTIFILTILFITPSVFALQQTSGALNYTISVGNSSTEKYGIRNDDNNSVNVKFNITGEASEFIIYEKNITLQPNEFRYIDVTASVPKEYKGNMTLKSTIYALKEGEKGGQAQINIRLGKNINLNIEEPPKEAKKSDNFMPTFIFIGVIFIVYVVMKNSEK